MCVSLHVLRCVARRRGGVLGLKDKALDYQQAAHWRSGSGLTRSPLGVSSVLALRWHLGRAGSGADAVGGTADGGFFDGEATFSATDKTLSVLDATFSVTDTTLSVVDATFSVTDKTLSVLDTTLSVTDKTRSVADTTFSVTDKTLSVVGTVFSSWRKHSPSRTELGPSWRRLSRSRRRLFRCRLQGLPRPSSGFRTRWQGGVRLFPPTPQFHPQPQPWPKLHSLGTARISRATHCVGIPA